MDYIANLKIGAPRALKSPGPFANWSKDLGISRRVAAGLAKAVNIGLTLACPAGLKLELLQRRLVAPSEISAERLQVARNFFHAFGNATARKFVRKIMIANYTDAIMTHHPRAQNLDRTAIQKKCELLVNTIFRRLEDVSSRPEFLFDVIRTMGRGTKDRESIWFPEYQEAYVQYKHTNKQAQRDKILFPHIVGNSLVDIGCGGGDQVADLKARHPEQLVRVAGIDTLDWRTPELKLKIDYYERDFSKPGTASPEQYDTGMALAVLHHVGNSDQALATFLTGVKTAVKTRLIVEEDVLITPQDLARTDIPGLEIIGDLRKQQPQLDNYLNLDQATQKAVTSLIDLLSNSLSVGVPDMSFPFGFRTLSDWTNQFAANGFILRKIQVLGFQKGNFNQSCHILFVLDKTA
ncbi:MAG: hypothetical protein NT099_07395 [Candidatus Saganbacteria bacterium]|nr:hypothetical protein [Candidatus Saganbacteria bacterium]